MKKFVILFIAVVTLLMGASACAAQEATVVLYSETGSSITVYESEVEEYTAVGWHKDAANVQTTLYAPGGKQCTVFNHYVNQYLSLGWSEEKPLQAYYEGEYVFDYGVFANESCMSYESSETTWSRLYHVADATVYENYVNLLKADGWLLYYKEDNGNEKAVYLVDKANSVMLCVMASFSENPHISIVMDKN